MPSPVERHPHRWTLVTTAVLLIVAPFGFLLQQVLIDGPVVRLDREIAHAVNSAVHDVSFATAAFSAITWLGSTPTLWLLVAATIAFTSRRSLHRQSLFVALTALSGQLLNVLIKFLVDRPRPDIEHPILEATGRSFPSGHATGSTVVFGAVLLAVLPFVPRRLRRAAVLGTALLVLLIGLSRVVLGVHFVSDVAAGHVLGLSWLALASAAFHLPGLAGVSDGGVELAIQSDRRQCGRASALGPQVGRINDAARRVR